LKSADLSGSIFLISMFVYVTLVLIIFFSGLGMSYLILRRLKEVKAMPEAEFLLKLKQTKPVFSDFNQYLVAPLVNLWKTVVLPAIYKEFEKFISRFRINLLKMEGWLLRLTNYIRGKRKIQNNGKPSPYWKDINEFKNGLNNKPE